MKYMQYGLLRRALKERGHRTHTYRFLIDHDSGTALVNDQQVGLVYPDSFFTRSAAMHNRRKSHTYYFNGLITESGGRRELLAPFAARSDARVVNSRLGRVNWLKDKYNYLYFRGMAESIFGLCPHHTDWPGNYLWTYRFVDCALAGTLPLLFRETPLADDFIDGFHYLWSNDGHLEQTVPDEYDLLVKHNFRLAKARFGLPATIEQSIRMSA